MKWFLYLAILGLVLTRIEGQSEFGNEVDYESDPNSPEEQETPEVESSEPTEPPEMQEAESSEPSEPPEMQDVESSDPAEIVPQDIQPSESDGTFESSVPAGQAVQSSSQLVLGGGGDEESNSEEAGGQGAAMNNAELAGGDSSQEDVGGGGVDGGAGLGGVPVDSEEVTNAIGNEIGTEPIPTQLIQSTVGYIVSTGSPIREATSNIINPNRGDAFFADFGPQEGAKDRQGSEPGDTESAASPQKIGLIVGATTAGTVAVAAGLAIAYVKLKGAGSAAAGGV
ncbi:uncharacterized protein [Antedon mediterranea]|uniref:uncharacterized protein n=1 Tax=Antedon mediterranea TaxID=105859 RepID=UPI003AF87FB8